MRFDLDCMTKCIGLTITHHDIWFYKVSIDVHLYFISIEINLFKNKEIKDDY